MSGNLVGNPISIKSPPALPGVFAGAPEDSREVRAVEADC